MWARAFCSNNCPYKVRRFNFFFYSDYRTESVRQQYNPDVTVRSRGVMEKCSYCVQRIRHAEIDSQVEGRPIVDGEILTACQSACPAQAILFGDMNDQKSKVKQWKESPLHYALLADLNTAPEPPIWQPCGTPIQPWRASKMATEVPPHGRQFIRTHWHWRTYLCRPRT